MTVANMNDEKGYQIGTLETYVTTRRTVRLNLGYWIANLETMRKRLNIPDRAEVMVQIPGGGDWSSELVPADDLDVVIRWESTEGETGALS